jgi:hypothetical protein
MPKKEITLKPKEKFVTKSQRQRHNRGLRLGEMEREALIAYPIEQFISDRMINIEFHG